MPYITQTFKNGDVLHASQLNIIDEQLKKISDAITSITYSEIDTSSIMDGYFISDDGDVSGSAIIYEYADIDFSSGNYYVTCRCGTNTSMYACELQDKNGQVLIRLFKSTGSAKIYERYNFSNELKEAGISWSEIGVIRICGNSSLTPKLEIGEDTITTAGAPTDIYPIMNYGVSVAAMGGSQATLTQGAGVAQEIRKKYLNFSKIDNYAVGGCGFVRKKSGGKTIPEQVEQAIATGTPYDLWILQCSTNDWKYGRECGDINDNPTTISEITTQCGGINYCIRRIHETYPNAKICLFTSTRFFKTNSSASVGSFEYFELGDSAWNPFSTDGANGKNFKHFIDKQKECCLKYNIPVLDLYSCTTYNEYNYNIYFKSDNIHWNSEGYKLHGYLQAQFLLNLI